MKEPLLVGIKTSNSQGLVIMREYSAIKAKALLDGTLFIPLPVSVLQRR